MEKPLDELVADMVALLNADQKADYDERRAIMEMEGKMARGHAESLALLNILHNYPAALTGVIVLKIELNGATRYLLTTNLDYARQHLASIGGVESGVRNLSEIIKEQYGGVALLTTVD